MVSASSKSKDFRHVRKVTVFQKPSGERIKVGGYRPSKKSSKDKIFQSSRNQEHDLPPVVDLRPFMTPVEQQGESSSCTANAMAGAYEYLANRLTKGRAGDVSRLFIYYNARSLDGDANKDEGSTLRTCVKVVKKHGACAEQTWPFDLGRLYDQPTKHAYQEAQSFLIEDAARVNLSLDAMRSCLAEGYPFVFGLVLFESFNRATETGGLVPVPDTRTEKHEGGHAMLCVGYSDPDQVFIVRNSWGADWGDEGYCYIPYDYMLDPEVNDGDCWVIRQIKQPIDLSHGVQKHEPSLFNPTKAAIARAIRVPGATHTSDGVSLFDNSYHITYEQELVYVDGGFISVDEVDVESLYYLDYEEFYEETEEYEETEDSYDEESESVEDDEESDEEFEEEEEEEDDESEDEESEDEEEEEETEASYDEESDEDEESEDEEEEESEDEESEDDEFEESEDDESEDEEEEETEASYDEESDEDESDEETEASYDEEDTEVAYEEEAEVAYEEEAVDESEGGDEGYTDEGYSEDE